MKILNTKAEFNLFNVTFRRQTWSLKKPGEVVWTNISTFSAFPGSRWMQGDRAARYGRPRRTLAAPRKRRPELQSRLHLPWHTDGLARYTNLWWQLYSQPASHCRHDDTFIYGSHIQVSAAFSVRFWIFRFFWIRIQTSKILRSRLPFTVTNRTDAVL